MKANRSVFSLLSAALLAILLLAGYWVTLKAKEWQVMGYLTCVQTNENGHRLARKTETLHQTAGFGGFPLLLYFDKLL
ncbi:MAG: hypothetical protein KJ638_04010 [Chloroflexi bacterium]|nr:hypothetical protein [Chloroflexota bacterium]